jgi:hypothetical protein
VVVVSDCTLESTCSLYSLVVCVLSLSLSLSLSTHTHTPTHKCICSHTYLVYLFPCTHTHTIIIIHILYRISSRMWWSVWYCHCACVRCPGKRRKSSLRVSRWPSSRLSPDHSHPSSPQDDPKSNPHGSASCMWSRRW